MSYKLEIEVKTQTHQEVVLINEEGHSFTFNPEKHEEFHDFLSGCKTTSNPN